MRFFSQDLALELLREEIDERVGRRDFRRFVRDARERLGTISRGANA